MMEDSEIILNIHEQIARDIIASHMLRSENICRQNMVHTTRYHNNGEGTRRLERLVLPRRHATKVRYAIKNTIVCLRTCACEQVL